MIPLVPKGATVPSIVTAFRAAGRRPIQVTRPISTLIGVLGEFVDYCTVGRDVLLHHTLAPLLVACESDWDAEARLTGMLRGQRPPALRSNIAPLVRRCPECVKDDLHKGFAYARVIHQLQHIVRCNDHGLPLQEVCGSCGEPFARYENGGSAIRINRCSRCGSSLGRDLHHDASGGYAALSQLTHTAISGNAAILKPQAMMPLLSRFLLAMRQESRDPVEFFCELWEVSDFSAAARKCGAPAAALRGVLSGSRNPRDVWSSIAAVSAATTYFSKRSDTGPDTEWLDPRAKCLQGDEFSTRILLRAHEFGISARLAHSFLRGQTSDANVLPRSRRLCFLASLSECDSRELERRVAARKAGDTFPELNTKMMRAFTKMAIAQGVHSRTAFAQFNTVACDWMGRHDSMWFERHLPVLRTNRINHALARDRLLDFRERGVVTRALLRQADRTFYNWMRANDPAFFNTVFPIEDWSTVSIDDARTAALALVARGRKSRTRIARSDNGLYRWLRENDHDWFEGEFPISANSRRSWVNMDVQRARKAAFAAVKGGPRERIRLFRADSTLCKWLRENDKDWFQREFPPRRRRIWSKMGLEDVRRAALDLVHGGPQDQIRVRQSDGGLYLWLLKNDKEWFYREFAVRPRGGVRGRHC